jgi:hypothetical protein
VDRSDRDRWVVDRWSAETEAHGAYAYWPPLTEGRRGEAAPPPRAASQKKPGCACLGPGHLLSAILRLPSPMPMRQELLCGRSP